MSFQMVVAMFPELALEQVELDLMDLGVPGMTISRVHGLGEYRNYYTKDCMADCIRMEIFTETEKTREIVNTIAKTVHQGLASDGIIAILPVEEFIHIKNFIGMPDDG